MQETREGEILNPGRSGASGTAEPCTTIEPVLRSPGAAAAEARGPYSQRPARREAPGLRAPCATDREEPGPRRQRKPARSTVKNKQVN